MKVYLKKESNKLRETEIYTAIKNARYDMGITDPFILTTRKALAYTMLQLGISSSTVGYMYMMNTIETAIEYLIKYEVVSATKIYRETSERMSIRYGKPITFKTIERGIRYTKESFWLKLRSELKHSPLAKRIFGSSIYAPNIPTNGEFIADIASYVLLCTYDEE